MAQIKTDSQHYQNIANKIREKTGETSTYYPANMDEGVDRVYEAGKKAELDRFWDNYQENGNKKRYDYAFGGQGWSDEVYKTIKYEIGSPSLISGMYRFNETITDTLKAIDCKNFVPLHNVFDGAERLKTIRSLKVYSRNTFTSTFQYCYKLEELYIEGEIGQNGFNVQWSTKLSHDSLMRILNILEDKTGDTSGITWVVTIGEANKAKLTEAELLVAYNKGWEVM